MFKARLGLASLLLLLTTPASAGLFVPSLQRACAIGAGPGEDMFSIVNRSQCTFYVSGVADTLEDLGLICMDGSALDGTKASQVGVAALALVEDHEMVWDSYPFIRDYLLDRFSCSQLSR